MIRTRDLFLFVTCFGFLIIAIAATLSLESKQKDSTSAVFLTASDAVAPGAVAVDDESAEDRASYIARLRDAIAADTVTIEPAASVTTDADTAAAVASSSVAAAAVQRCLYPDDVLPYIAQWPLQGVALKNESGQRVFYSQTVVSSASTSSAPQTIETSLLQVPIQPAQLPAASCVPSEIVGVTAQGILMFNTDVRSYQNLSQDTLVGYARDGYPIYGLYSDEVDECGGYQHPAGYRYSVSPERDFLIGCFKATPQSFTL